MVKHAVSEKPIAHGGLVRTVSAVVGVLAAFGVILTFGDRSLLHDDVRHPMFALRVGLIAAGSIALGALIRRYRATSSVRKSEQGPHDKRSGRP